jgi:hypothetical protein
MTARGAGRRPLVCIKNEYTTISTCGLSNPTTVVKAAKAAKAVGARGRGRGSGRGRGGLGMQCL